MQMRDEEKLVAIYERLKVLREGGAKMKDLARAVGLAPSVLSVLYTTVLPVFSAQLSRMGLDAALDAALREVNNLSRKRLMEQLDSLYAGLNTYANYGICTRDIHPFLRFLDGEARLSVTKAAAFEGVYMSYSCSSSVRALKAEPYYIRQEKDSRTLIVGRKSVHDSIREGIGIIQEQQCLYLFFNAFKEPSLSLVSVYLQLPFLEEVDLLKGLYLVLDYNKNPIARRIVFVKQSEEYEPELFVRMPARLIMKGEFSEEEQQIYNYVCGRADLLKMCTLPSPKLDLRDLEAEKKLLDSESMFNGEP